MFSESKTFICRGLRSLLWGAVCDTAEEASWDASLEEWQPIFAKKKCLSYGLKLINTVAAFNEAKYEFYETD